MNNDENKNVAEKEVDLNDPDTFSDTNPVTSNYFDFVRKIVDKVHIMKLSQLIMMLQGKFDFPEKKCLEIILDAQKNNYFLVSKDGYVMTLGYYLMATDDKFFDGTEINNYYNHINFNFKSYIKDEKGLIDCMTVVANMMPVSEHFFLPAEPWDVMYCTPPELVGVENSDGVVFQPSLYELVYIPKETSSVVCLALNELKVDDLDARPFIKRFAVLEDENDAYKVPYVGFTNIVCIKKDVLKIIEQRDNPWEIGG